MPAAIAHLAGRRRLQMPDAASRWPVCVPNVTGVLRPDCTHNGRGPAGEFRVNSAAPGDFSVHPAPGLAVVRCNGL
jgi:hypothetical protein